MRSRYTVELARDWHDNVGAVAARALAASPFQKPVWLAQWYATLGRRRDVQPIIAIVRERSSGDPVALFPLVGHAAGNRRIVQFADLGITDYNAPLLFAGAPTTRAGAVAMLQALTDALEREGDLLRLIKMPAMIGSMTNPLALLPSAETSPLGSNLVRIDGSWESYHRSLDGKVRRELERSWRLFVRDGVDARFVRASDPGEAKRILAQLSGLQRERITSLGKPYVLDEEGCHDFYERLIEQGLGSGYTVVTALISGEFDVVAGLLSVSDGRSLAMLRLGQAGGAWARCSPGRLLFDRTMHAMHAAGLTEFDFTIGDYAYKETFRVERTPLVDVIRPLTLRGRATFGFERAGMRTREHLRSMPFLYEALKRIAGGIRGNRRGLGSLS